jgi:hypothetical protein
MVTFYITDPRAAGACYVPGQKIPFFFYTLAILSFAGKILKPGKMIRAGG